MSCKIGSSFTINMHNFKAFSTVSGQQSRLQKGCAVLPRYSIVGVGGFMGVQAVGTMWIHGGHSVLEIRGGDKGLEGQELKWREDQREEEWINWIEENTRNTGTRINNSVIGLISDFRD